MSVPPPQTLLVTCALAVLGGAIGLVGGALAFQYWGGLAPCDLCLPQRGPPTAAAVMALWVLACAALAPGAARMLLAAAVPVLLTGAALGLHHAGIEQHWWAGPAACTGHGVGLPGSAADFADSLKNTKIVRCDEIAWQMFGLSLAGYNALISTLLAAIAAVPFVASKRRTPA